MKNKKIFISIFLFWVLILFFKPVYAAEPKDCPIDIKAIIGLYQTEGENILIRENDGRLELLYGVTLNDYSFKHSNVFMMEKNHYDEYNLIVANPRDYKLLLTAKFERDKLGRGITCIIDKKRYTRNFTLADDGEKLEIKPTVSYEELKGNALNSLMPKQNDNLLKAELVEVIKIDPTIKVDMIYSKESDLVTIKMYEKESAFLDIEAAKALKRVNDKLKNYGYGIVIWDAYRPWYVSKMFNDVLPEGKKHLLELPEKGSPHNKGLSVDVSLYNVNSGAYVNMISKFDEISLRTYADFQGRTSLERYQRDLLIFFMESEGFTGVDHEWWHFDFKNFENYELLNTEFKDIN